MAFHHAIVCLGGGGGGGGGALPILSYTGRPRPPFSVYERAGNSLDEVNKG